MEWLSCLNEAVNYMEEHLEDEINLEQVARIARCSAFHFQRMFSYLADIPLSEYIRRRKMTRAAFDLQNGDLKIIDIALKYGYDSPTAFNRAFRSVHSIAPSAARAAGAALKAYPPISFKITIKGEAEMNYRIEKKGAFKIVGLKQHYSLDIEESYIQVPKFWAKAKDSIAPKLCPLMDREPKGILGVCTNMEDRDFDYFIAVATNQKTPEGMADYLVPECTWAIFECVGKVPAAVQILQKRIFGEWLPSSGYEYANAPDLEVYFDGDQKSDDYKCEVWLPVVKK